ncbi:4Fe-4S ferredoxin iron-sulfur binding domain protein [Desulfofarcimen acetoxidans DSM 771]|uniref:4Fe-4S ferredoxin iron-sulfur binding domain protein n=1 Tax=Desulfofarcimen acetoxidans (strain ATCC 49208 / DSM 771 / KCTC 5769 / VKM B-1644 / 5575) TaxID=485916 RepID=C8W6G6_DESAS|nr:FAD-dependent oxidoreductase [Desulfofarcimen acetoxidans]ACV62255.1 4Fe-4S ferredoxin iron-sulfur binding domain protein [Desulfofarcimen acetoxidans DSM 771]
MRAVLVVGAGLAGTKAALDLAEAGFDVYMVEKLPFVGGTMPKLDKMFPTHDCLICTLSPSSMDMGCKLSLVNRHPNIRTIINAQILDFTGRPGDFQVTLNGTCSVPTEPLNSCKIGMDLKAFTVNVGSVILSPGFKVADPGELSYYKYGIYPNIVTSLEFEEILKASKTSEKAILRPSDYKPAQKIAWIQCAGSRNEKLNKGYCSSICCMFAIKEAMMVKECSAEIKTKIFSMDLRIHGKGYEKYHRKAEKDYRIDFVASRIFEINQIEESHNLGIRYAAEDGTLYYEEFDLVVLSIGMEPPEDALELSEIFGIALDRFNFAKTVDLTGVCTTAPGIFVAGAFAGPKDIPETIAQASACVAEVALAAGEEKYISGEPLPLTDNLPWNPRTGVFICTCNNQLDSILDLRKIAEKLGADSVHIVSEICTREGKFAVQNIIKHEKYSHIIIAACGSRTSAFFMKQLVKECGLPESLLQIVNIREQCAWVHANEPAKATLKAFEQIRMAFVKASMSTVLPVEFSHIVPAVLIVGGGIVGLTSALYLAKLGFRVHMVEKEAVLGGKVARIKVGLKGENISVHLQHLVNEVINQPNIKIYLKTQVKSHSGFVGNFKSLLSSGEVVRHAVTIIASGGQEYISDEYYCNQDPRVYTQLQLEEAIYKNDASVRKAKNIVMIQCVGSRDKDQRTYCSKICCTKSLKLALQLKEQYPDKNIFILYRDIRTYGTFEKYYSEARLKGIIFIRYNLNNKPVLEKTEENLKVYIDDHILGQKMEIEADIISLATGVAASAENPKLARIFSLPLEDNGFFKEAHMKLRPIDFNTNGVFVCGLAHAPKSIEESIVQAKAAVGRSCTILYKDYLQSAGPVAVNNGKCAACLTCTRVCPYGIPRVINNKVFIDPVQCKGCGICTVECPHKAIELQNMSDEIMMAMIRSLFIPVEF